MLVISLDGTFLFHGNSNKMERKEFPGNSLSSFGHLGWQVHIKCSQDVSIIISMGWVGLGREIRSYARMICLQ
jgi:hypothetical protein